MIISASSSGIARGLARPGITTISALRINGQRPNTTILGNHNNTAARAAPAPAIILNRERTRTIGIDGPRPADRIRTNHHNATTSRATAVKTEGISAGAIVRCTRAATTTQDQSRGRTRERRTAVATGDISSVPSPAAHAAKTAVASSSASAILIIVSQVRHLCCPPHRFQLHPVQSFHLGSPPPCYRNKPCRHYSNNEAYRHNLHPLNHLRHSLHW